MKLLFSLFFILIILPLSILGYLGFIPKVSSIFGSDKPRDLGIKSTQLAYDQALSKTGTPIIVQSVNSPITQSVKTEGSHPVNLLLTPEELTSSSYLAPKWKYNPFRQVQFKINPDNSVELSGVANVERLIGLGIYLGAPEKLMREGIDKFHLSKTTLPVYISGTFSNTNNKLTSNISKLEVGRLPLPQSLVSQYEPLARQAIESALVKLPGYSCQSAGIKDGQFYFTGFFPDKLIVASD